MAFSGFDLEGKVALVTGATKGLGYGIAKALATAGANTIVVSRHQNDCERVAAELTELGRKSIPISADVKNVSSIEELVSKALKNFDSIDILVNNAGVAATTFPEDVTEEEWDHVLDINLKGAFFMSQHVGRQMIKQQRGKIINMGSVYSFIGDGGIVSYCASKGGLNVMTKSLALAWARHNINVNMIAPGYVKTEMNKEMLSQDKVFNSIVKNIPVRQLGEVDDITGAVVFLASDAANYMTGQTIVIDGGMTAH